MMPPYLLELRFSLPPAGMRRNHEVNRFLLNKLKDAYSVKMGQEMAQQPNARTMTAWARRWPIRKYALHAEVTWYQCGDGDTDNCLSSLKPLFDVIGCAPATKAGASRYYIGVYESDAQIKRICVERKRVAHKVDECVRISLKEFIDG